MEISNDYLAFLLRIPNLTPMSLLSFFFLTLMRIAPLVALVPYLGNKLPGGAKIGLALTLTIILLPHAIMSSSHPVGFDFGYMGLCLKEIFIGTVLAIIAAFPFYIAQSSGVIIDFQRGSSALMITDPVMQSQISPIGLLYNYTLIVLFFQLGGPFLFLESLFDSFAVVPCDTFLSSRFFSDTSPFWNSFWHILNRFMALSIQLAAPSLLAILMAEAFLGIANRLAPQVQIAFLGMSLKSLLGLALLWAGWFFILDQMGKQSLVWTNQLRQLIEWFKY